MVMTPDPHRRQSSPITVRGLCLHTILPGVCLLVICLAQLVPARPLPAEKPDKPYALIYGTVWSPDNRPVYGVTVKIRRANEKKTRWELLSDHHGEFAQRVPAGKESYIVWADLKGFKLADGKHLQPGDPVQVQVEYDERVDIGVHLK